MSKKPLDLEENNIKKMVKKDLSIKVFADVDRAISLTIKEIKQRIKSAVQELLDEIENRREMLERTINYVTQERECRIKARIDELDTILWKIKKYFPEEVKENDERK